MNKDIYKRQLYCNGKKYAQNYKNSKNNKNKNKEKEKLNRAINIIGHFAKMKHIGIALSNA